MTISFRIIYMLFACLYLLEKMFLKKNLFRIKQELAWYEFELVDA